MVRNLYEDDLDTEARPADPFGPVFCAECEQPIATDYIVRPHRINFARLEYLHRACFHGSDSASESWPKRSA
jgi:hypothetical protein